MATSKSKAIPATADAIAKPKDLAAEILTALRHISAEEQNLILEVVIKEIALDRINACEITQNERNRASENFERFLRLQNTAEATIKEREVSLNKKNFG